MATFSGIMSACFAFGLTAGNPISEASFAAGTNRIWSGLPKLVVVLWGGFTTNAIWCLILNMKNRTGVEYFTSHTRPDHSAREPSVGHHGTDTSISVVRLTVRKMPPLGNYMFSALAGTTWYFQFFFYTMGETQIGRFGFASWTLHMASIIIFSTMWGWILHEWRGSGKKAHTLIALGIAALILSTVIIGYGSYLKGHAVD